MGTRRGNSEGEQKTECPSVAEGGRVCRKAWKKGRLAEERGNLTMYFVKFLSA